MVRPRYTAVGMKRYIIIVIIIINIIVTVVRETRFVEK